MQGDAQTDASLASNDPKMLQEFEMGDVKPHSAIAFIGRRRSGKTTAMISFVQNMIRNPTNTIKRIIVFAGNYHCGEEWKCLPSSCVHQVSIPHMEHLHTYQNSRYHSAKYDLLIIFDDCGSRRDIMNHRIMQEYLCNGRHLRTTLMYSLQHLYQLPPSGRGQLDLVCIVKMNNIKYMKNVHDEYCSNVAEESLLAISNGLSNQRRVMVIDNGSSTDGNGSNDASNISYLSVTRGEFCDKPLYQPASADIIARIVSSGIINHTPVIAKPVTKAEARKAASKARMAGAIPPLHALDTPKLGPLVMHVPSNSTRI